jgi:hypothetical protein
MPHETAIFMVTDVSKYFVNFVLRFPLATFAVLNFHISSQSAYIILLHLIPKDFDCEESRRVLFRIIAIRPSSLRDVIE